MKLSIENYNLLNFNNENIVISTKGVSRISSPSLLEVIKKLGNRKSISDTDLYRLFNEHELDRDDAYRSLEAALGLKKQEGKLFFDGIIVAHDWEDDKLLQALISSELSESTITCLIPELSEATKNASKKIIAIIYKNYDYNNLKKTYFELAIGSPDSMIIVCYSAGDNYIIGQPYFPRIGSPCHFCSIDKLINHETYKTSKNTWSSLLNFCRNKFIPTPSAQPTLYQKTLIIGAIIEKIKLMNSVNGINRYQDNILQETNLSLRSGYASDFTVAHWCMCDCLRINK